MFQRILESSREASGSGCLEGVPGDFKSDLIIGALKGVSGVFRDVVGV